MNVYRKWYISGRITSKSSEGWLLAQLIVPLLFSIGETIKFPVDAEVGVKMPSIMNFTKLLCFVADVVAQFYRLISPA